MRTTRHSLNELRAVGVLVAAAVASGDSELGDVGVGSGSQTIARVGRPTERAGSSEDAGGSQEGGDQELSVGEHRENERRKVRLCGE